MYIVQVRRNNLRLASIQHTAQMTSVVDQATQAISAVFVMNLILSLPHGIFHLLENPSHTSDIVLHSIFFMHFVGDPLLFLWFNTNYRKQVAVWFRTGVQYIKSCYPTCKTSPSVFYLDTSSSTCNVLNTIS